MSRDTSSSRGIRFLEDSGVSFEVVEYIYKKKGGKRAAGAVGWAQEQVVKSLVARFGPKDFCFALVPTHRDLSTKRLARLFGVKSAEMADPRDAERLTGYVQGGISPFGSYAALRTVIDESLLEYDQVLINAGHRGLLVAMSPWDIVELLEAEVDEIATD